MKMWKSGRECFFGKPAREKKNTTPQPSGLEPIQTQRMFRKNSPKYEGSIPGTST